MQSWSWTATPGSGAACRRPHRPPPSLPRRSPQVVCVGQVRVVLALPERAAASTGEEDHGTRRRRTRHAAAAEPRRHAARSADEDPHHRMWCRHFLCL